jgi:hypothetical protein
MMISASVFVSSAAVLCIAAVLGVFGTTQVYLAGPEAIKSDGLARGMLAPAWSLADSSGRTYRSPPRKPMQLIVFSDHSLKSFPSVVEGLHELIGDTELEIVVLLRHPSDIAEPVLRLLGLDGIPVLTGSPSMYGWYNVRVTPFVIFVDSTGRVRGSSLVNHAWQIATLRRVASVPLTEAETSARSRLPRRLSKAGV